MTSVSRRIPASLAALVVPVATLKPYGKNPRRGDVAAIAASLEANGQFRPLVVNERTGEVLAGNHTLQAALELGWSEVAVTFVDVDEHAAARIVLADNRTNDLASYDNTELVSLLQSLGDDDEALAGSGYHAEALAGLLDELERARSPDGRDTRPMPLPSSPVTRPGDLWRLGEHRLLCGSAVDPAAVTRLLDGAKPMLLVTDPPYGVSLDMEWRELPSGPDSYMRDGPGLPHTNVSMSGDTIVDWSPAYELVPSLKVAYVWHASRHSIPVGLGLERLGFELSQQIIWDKRLFALSRAHYHFQHEPCWYARRKGSRKFLGPHTERTVWAAPSPKMIMARRSGVAGDEACDHPTQKPLELYLRPIRNHLRARELLYDPFAGSGTAVIACENLGRRCLTMDVDPRYCDVVVDRWRRHTGRDPVLEEADGVEAQAAVAAAL